MQKVSFIITAYNNRNFVSECVRSCLEQTYSNIEVVITDDGSTDDSHNILLSEFGLNPAVKILKFEKNSGKVSGFNNSFAHTTGEFIAVIGADDINYPDRIERQLMALENHNLTYIDANMDKVDECGKLLESMCVRRKNGHCYTLEELVINPCISGNTLLFRRSAGQPFFPMDARLSHEDHWLPIMLAYQGQGMFLDKAVIRYRQHKTNTSKRFPTQKSYYYLYTREEQHYRGLLEFVMHIDLSRLDRRYPEIIKHLKCNFDKIQLIKAKSLYKKLHVLRRMISYVNLFDLIKLMPKLLPFSIYYQIVKHMNQLSEKRGSRKKSMIGTR
jgi:Glycosyltransferases involved in cell wall biogenesis